MLLRQRKRVGWRRKMDKAGAKKLYSFFKAMFLTTAGIPLKEMGAA